VSDPDLLFLDEPPPARSTVRGSSGRGARIQGPRQDVLLTTHYMDEAERLCDRVAIVDKGKVIALGTPRS